MVIFPAEDRLIPHVFINLGAGFFREPVQDKKQVLDQDGKAPVAGLFGDQRGVLQIEKQKDPVFGARMVILTQQYPQHVSPADVFSELLDIAQHHQGDHGKENDGKHPGRKKDQVIHHRGPVDGHPYQDRDQASGEKAGQVDKEFLNNLKSEGVFGTAAQAFQKVGSTDKQAVKQGAEHDPWQGLPQVSEKAAVVHRDIRGGRFNGAKEKNDRVNEVDSKPEEKLEQDRAGPLKQPAFLKRGFHGGSPLWLK